MVKRILFKISEDGSVAVEAQGFEGKSCEEATRPFEEVLGTVETKTYKEEAYNETSHQVEESL